MSESAREAKRVAEAEALRIDQMNAAAAAKRIVYENSEAGREEKRVAEAEAVRIAKMNARYAEENEAISESALGTSGKTPADIREAEKRIAYENSESGREAKRIADEANLKSAAEAKRVAEAYRAQLWQGAAIRLPGITHRSVYDEAGNLTQVEGFSRDEDGNTTFNSTKFIKSEGDGVGDGSDVAAEAESIRPATPVGLNIIVLRGQEPIVTIDGKPADTEGAATHGVGLDGFLLGFLANND